MADSEEKKDAQNEEDSKDKDSAEEDKSKDSDSGESEKKDFFESIKEAGFEDELKKYVQSEADKRVSEAIKTHDKKLEEKQRKEKEAADKKKKEEAMTDTEKKWAAYDERFERLTTLVEGMASSQKEEKLDAKKEEALKAAKLPVELKAYINVEKEEEIAQHIPTLKNIFGSFKDAEIKEWVTGQGKGPLRSTSTSDEDAKAEIREYLEEKKKDGGGGQAADQLGLNK